MSRRLIACVLLVSFLVLPSWQPTLSGDEPAPGRDAKEDAKEDASPTADWHADADCRLVFFAVLEGLYTDGVPNDVVDLIVGAPPAGADPNPVKRCFVFRCDLCHAVYEALALYRRRPAFNGGGGRDTFGATPIDAGLIERLKSDEPQTRVFAMGELVQPWIKRKLTTMRMPDAERRALVERLMKLVQEGRALTSKWRSTDPAYKDWRFYGSCQACEAVDTVRRTLRRQQNGPTQPK